VIGAALVLSLLAGMSPAASEPAVVWAVGDGANGSPVAKRLARRIERDRPDAFLYLGDVYPTGTATDFEQRYDPIYGPLADITWPTPGNHEWGNRAIGYEPYWRTRGRGKPWYRVRIGGWEVISLNSEAPHGPGSRQLRWLKRVLARGEGTCRLAFWHRPRFSAGTVHGDAPDVAPLWNALRGHARLVLNGHEHTLERLRRRDGLTEYVAGAGGSVLYPLQADRRLAFGKAGQTGALRMTLAPGRARLEFRAVDGQVLDRSAASCRPRRADTLGSPANRYVASRGR
jgi:Calcineurin-like phosphoesterase